jgi:hypothetical protein
MHQKSSYFSRLAGIITCGVTGWLLVLAPPTHAATVWNGPLITYNQPSPDPSQASNQDRITADVWLTRAVSKGLFNAYSETNATTLSPANTEWAFGTLSNYTSLHYTNWLAWLNGQSPVTLIGQQVVVHLITDDVYLSLEFTTWVAGGSGGFAYQRSTLAPPVVNLSGVEINSGQFTFNYTAVTGLSYAIQSSTNFLNWVSLTTNVASGSPMPFSEPIISTGARFYRVVRLANP